MEHLAVFEERIPLNPKDLNRLAEVTVETLLLEKIRAKLEGRCSRHGYVVPGSLEIVSRSMGHVEVGRFTGDVVYQVQAQGQVLNPSDGSMIVGEVLKKNKMGIYIEYRDAIHIILPRDLHKGSDEFENLETGVQINVEVKKSRFQVNDPFIQCVGLYKGPATAEVAAEVAASAEESTEAGSPGLVE